MFLKICLYILHLIIKKKDNIMPSNDISIQQPDSTANDNIELNSKSMPSKQANLTANLVPKKVDIDRLKKEYDVSERIARNMLKQFGCDVNRAAEYMINTTSYYNGYLG